MTDRRARRGRTLLLGVALGTLLVALPGLATAHAELVSSTPTAGANLASPPSEVTLTFDDELDPDASSFTVTDAEGAQVGGGTVDLNVADRNVMDGQVTISQPGVYTVTYTVAGLDGHAISGSFTFGFQADAPPPDTSMHRSSTGTLTVLGLVLLAASLVAASAAAGRRLLR